MKIEHIIKSCHECRYMIGVQDVNSNGFYACICGYSLLCDDRESDNIHPFMVVATSSSRDVIKNPIKIPQNCPLEDYNEKLGQ